MGGALIENDYLLLMNSGVTLGHESIKIELFLSVLPMLFSY